MADPINRPCIAIAALLVANKNPLVCSADYQDTNLWEFDGNGSQSQELDLHRLTAEVYHSTAGIQ